jgi:hypothetical protein
MDSTTAPQHFYSNPESYHAKDKPINISLNLSQPSNFQANVIQNTQFKQDQNNFIYLYIIMFLTSWFNFFLVFFAILYYLFTNWDSFYEFCGNLKTLGLKGYLNQKFDFFFLLLSEFLYYYLIVNAMILWSIFTWLFFNTQLCKNLKSSIIKEYLVFPSQSEQNKIDKIVNNIYSLLFQIFTSVLNIISIFLTICIFVFKFFDNFYCIISSKSIKELYLEFYSLFKRNIDFIYMDVWVYYFILLNCVFFGSVFFKKIFFYIYNRLMEIFNNLAFVKNFNKKLKFALKLPTILKFTFGLILFILLIPKSLLEFLKYDILGFKQPISEKCLPLENKNLNYASDSSNVTIDSELDHTLKEHQESSLKSKQRKNLMKKKFIRKLNISSCQSDCSEQTSEILHDNNNDSKHRIILRQCLCNNYTQGMYHKIHYKKLENFRTLSEAFERMKLPVEGQIYEYRYYKTK